MSTTLSPTTPSALVPRLHTIVAARRQTHDVVTLDLAPVPDKSGGGDAEDPPGGEPGQFMMLYAHGVGEAPISVSSGQGDAHPLSVTIRAVGTTTRALTALQPGTMAGLRGPYGRPWPLAEAEGGDLLVIAGGIGLAPVRPVVLHALANRDRFRRLVVCVGARTPGDLVFRDDLDRWEADPRVELWVTVDQAVRGWAGMVGLVTKPLTRMRLDPDVTTAVTCGPEIMMRFSSPVLLERGVPATQIFVTLERNMRCAVATCGHCQLGPVLVCRDGAVFSWPEVADLLAVREL